jgi:putative CGCGG family rSAM target protein
MFARGGSVGQDERRDEMTASHDSVEPVTESTHDNSWSANLEKPHHAEDRELVVAQARDAVAHTVAGNHVNLVTHGDHGHPGTYLYDELDAAYGDRVDYEYVEQCGCGGHVTRVHVREG